MARESALRIAADSGLGSDLRAAYRSSWVMYSQPEGFGYEASSAADGGSVLISAIDAVTLPDDEGSKDDN